MLIHCPSCDFETTLPASKEGAKLRCPECSRVFVARPPRSAAGRSAGGSSSSTRNAMIAGGVVVGLGLWFMFGRDTGPSTPPAPKPVAAAEQKVTKETEGTGWDSPSMVFVRALHESAFNKDETRLLIDFDWARTWSASHPDEEAWETLPRARQTEIQAEVVADLTRGEASKLIAEWEPFDGWVESQDNETRVIRLRVAQRENSESANRHVEWHVVKIDDRWKAFAWTRWISAEEQEAIERGERATIDAAKPKIERKTLSDGSKVIESTVRPIPYMHETPPELRERIDTLVAELIDNEAAAGVQFRAKQALTEIGKPAIPRLMTVIAEVPHTDMEAGMKLQQVNLALQDITGYYTSFKPHITLGATEERQESGLKQWFGWYDRKFKRFEEAVDGPDPLGEGDEDE